MFNNLHVFYVINYLEMARINILFYDQENEKLS